jgi:hypothetical protein
LTLGPALNLSPETIGEKKMRRSMGFLAFFLAVLAIPAVARNVSAEPDEAGQDEISRFNVYGSYGYVRSNIVVDGTRINLNGGTASIAYNWKSWVAFAGDFGIYHQSKVTANAATLTISTFQAGPRLRWRKWRRVTPFAEGLVGLGHAGGSLYSVSQTVGFPAFGASTALVLTAGGGADWQVSRNFAIRMIQADYLYSQFKNNGQGNR